MMKRLFSTLIIVLSLIDCMAAQNTNGLLDKVARKLASAQSVTASCVISTNGQSESAILTMAGKCFRLQSSGMEIWYDGKTQWVYSAQTNEVTVTEPTPEELAQTNPLVVIDFFRKNYSAASGKGTKGFSKLTLKSLRSDSEISSAEIMINDATMMPSTMDLTMSNGMKVAITVSGIKTGTTVKESTFRFDRKSHPEAEIIDLR